VGKSGKLGNWENAEGIRGISRTRKYS